MIARLLATAADFSTIREWIEAATLVRRSQPISPSLGSPSWSRRNLKRLEFVLRSRKFNEVSGTIAQCKTELPDRFIL
jgi:hypothetical protein